MLRRMYLSLELLNGTDLYLAIPRPLHHKSQLPALGTIWCDDPDFTGL